MELSALLVGISAGLALSVGRLYVERVLSRRFGLAPQIMFMHRDVLVPFLVLAGAANVYALLIISVYGGIAAWRLSAVIGLVMLVVAQLLQIHIAVRPSKRDLDLALASCAPYIYLFGLYLAALANNSYTLWLF